MPNAKPNTTPGRVVVQLDSDIGGVLDPIVQDGSFLFVGGTRRWALNSWATWKITLQGQHAAAYRTKIAPVLMSVDRTCRLRLGVDSGSSTRWLPYQTLYALDARIDLAPAVASMSGYTVVVTLVDMLYPLTLTSRITTRRGPIDRMVADIADGVDLAAVVEPTSASISALLQCYQDDWAFIMERMLPRAVNAAGAGPYSIYAVGDTLRCHTPGYNVTTWDMPYNRVAAREISNLVTDFAGEVFSPTVIVYDPLAGTSRELDVDPARYTRFSAVLTEAVNQGLAAAHVGFNQVAYEESKIAATYGASRGGLTGVQVDVSNTFDINVGDIVNVVLDDPQDPVNGNYLVMATSMDITNSLVMSITARRGELASSRQSSTGISATAPGKLYQPRAVADPGSKVITPVG